MTQSTALASDDWDNELHPDWCNHYACEIHVSETTSIPTGYGQTVVTSTEMDELGRVSIPLFVEDDSTTDRQLSPDEAEAFVAAMLADADTEFVPLSASASWALARALVANVRLARTPTQMVPAIPRDVAS